MMTSDLGFSHVLTLYGLSLNFQGIIEIFPFAFLILGIMYSFFGKELFGILNFAIGGSIAAGFVYYNEIAIESEMYILLILAFLIFGAVAYFAPYLLVAAVGFIFGMGLLLPYSEFLGVLFGIILAAVAIVLLRFLLPVVTAVIGGIIGGVAAFSLTGFDESFFIITFVLSVGGSIFQLLRSDSNLKRLSRE